MIQRIFLVAASFLTLAAAAWAQSERYTTGQRLVKFDRAWEKYRDDPAARKRALKYLLAVVPNFFSANWPKASQLLDQARQALASKDGPVPAVQWAESLSLMPIKRLLEKNSPSLRLTLDQFYVTGVDVPDQAQLVLQFLNKGKALASHQVPIKDLPLTVDLPTKSLPEGDYVLQARIVVAGKELATDEQTISVVDQPQQRLAALEKSLEAVPPKAGATDVKTVEYLIWLIKGLAKGYKFDADYPAARLLSECEAALKELHQGTGFYGGNRAGQFWLKLATAEGDFVSRLLVPEQAANGKLPLVVALHGAGASENLFFEGYGNGLIVKLCQERGWLLVSPRSGYLAFTLPVSAIVDAVAKLYPVDRDRVVVVGHSMGASQAVSAAQQHPKLFAAISALGGSGKVTAAEKLKHVPFYVGVGTSDFALEGARLLTKQLKSGGVNVELKEFPDIEHIMIVREGLPDTFALFDKALKK